MIRVEVPTSAGNEVVEWPTNTCEIIDGALVLLEDKAGQLFTIGGYAGGTWLTFQVVPDED